MLCGCQRRPHGESWGPGWARGWGRGRKLEGLQRLSFLLPELSSELKPGFPLQDRALFFLRMGY